MIMASTETPTINPVLSLGALIGVSIPCVVVSIIGVLVSILGVVVCSVVSFLGSVVIGILCSVVATEVAEVSEKSSAMTVELANLSMKSFPGGRVSWESSVNVRMLLFPTVHVNVTFLSALMSPQKAHSWASVSCSTITLWYS